MPECQECDIFKTYSGTLEKVREVKKFKDDLVGPNGTFDRIFAAIDSKAPKYLLLTMIIILFGLLGSTFGLVYFSNMEIIKSVNQVKIDIAIIKERTKIDIPLGKNEPNQTPNR